MSLTTRKMSDRHEEDLAEVLGGRRTRNSGASWVDQTDGKTDNEQTFNFAWDGKSTLGESVSISRKAWRKVKEQARTRIPAFPIRFYTGETLTRVDIDLIAVPLDVFAEMLPLANRMAKVEQAGCLSGAHDFTARESDSVPGMMVKNGPCSGCGNYPYEVM